MNHIPTLETDATFDGSLKDLELFCHELEEQCPEWMHQIRTGVGMSEVDVAFMVFQLYMKTRFRYMHEAMYDSQYSSKQ